MGGREEKDEGPVVEPLEQLHTLIARASDGDPDHVTIELPFAQFGEVGAALDAATEILAARGYHLARVRAEADKWSARYER